MHKAIKWTVARYWDEKLVGRCLYLWVLPEIAEEALFLFVWISGVWSPNAGCDSSPHLNKSGVRERERARTQYAIRGSVGTRAGSLGLYRPDARTHLCWELLKTRTVNAHLQSALALQLVWGSHFPPGYQFWAAPPRTKCNPWKEGVHPSYSAGLRLAGWVHRFYTGTYVPS